MCLKTCEYIMGLENLQQFFQFVLKPHQVKNPVVAHISLAAWPFVIGRLKRAQIHSIATQNNTNHPLLNFMSVLQVFM